MSDVIEMMIEPRVRTVGNGEVRRLLPYRERRMVGPFVFCDVMGPESFDEGAAMNIDAHPHIGLSTLTYLLRGRAVHRDSTGAVQTIEPGAVNWMTAGGGVTHTERSHPDDVDRVAELFGVQTWVALPGDAEDGPSAFEHCGRDDVPTERTDGVEIRVAAGSAFGHDAPVTGSSPLALVEVVLTDGTVRVERDHRERAVLAMTDGLTLHGQSMAAGSLAVLDTDTSPTLGGRGTAMILAGEPVGSRHIWWNFVHSDRDRIDDAKRRWESQEFPLVPDDHEPYVPLPT